MRKVIILICSMLLAMPLLSNAETDLNSREAVFSFLKDAFEAQVALSEQERSKEEIRELLNPYFSEEYQQIFWDENIQEYQGKYLTYGTDSAQYYIPFYQFSDATQVVIEENKIYVFEYFPASTEGPIGYDSHYEGLLIERIDEEWVVSKYLYDNIPENIINGGENVTEEPVVVTPFKTAEQNLGVDAFQAASVPFQLSINPIGSFLQYGFMAGSDQVDSFLAMFNEHSGEQLALEN